MLQSGGGSQGRTGDRASCGEIRASCRGSEGALDAGFAAQRREMDFWVDCGNFDRTGAIVALSGGSHACGDCGRLRKVVVRSGTCEDAGERRLQWELEVVLREKVWVLGW